ncbi:MAG TPA: lysophospholipase [Alphaproteobacteria bacterium]|jgi:acylglycerol lipase|nr:lysophospholipase [Alphaproteobacteria bacterium]
MRTRLGGVALAAALLGALQASGCAPVKVPAGPATETARLEVTSPHDTGATRPAVPHKVLADASASTDPVLGTFVASDGAELPLRAWLPADPALRTKPKAVVIGVHGFNDYSNAFDMPGRYWIRDGIATYAYDQRGFGRGPHPGYWAGADTMAKDLGDVARLLQERYPGTPIYYIGESMGAAIIMRALATDEAPRPAGTILSAPAVWGRDYMPFYQRWTLWVASHVTPWLRLSGRGLGYVASDNNDMLRALGRDPLVIKDTRTDAIKGLVDAMDKGMRAVRELPGPALILMGAHDQIVPLKPQWAAVGQLPDPKNQRVAYYKNGWHMLLRDLQAEHVWVDVATWIANHNAPLPSQADAVANAERSKYDQKS